MRKCIHCGREYSEDVLNCMVDGKPVLGVFANGALVSARPSWPTKRYESGRYRRFEDVPWYRREPGIFGLIGVFLCGLITIALCVLCLSGHIYKNSYNKDGSLQVWGAGNKIAAVMILVLQGFLVWVFFYVASGPFDSH